MPQILEGDFHKLSILMHFRRKFEFSTISAERKRGTFSSDISVCCVVFLRFSLVCDCVFMLSCYVYYCLGFCPLQFWLFGSTVISRFCLFSV